MSIFSFIAGVFNKFVGIFKAFLAEALPIAKQIIIGSLKDIAINAVTKAQATDLNNEQKRNQAFNEIKTYAIANGIEARDSLLNTLLELALQKLKG